MRDESFPNGYIRCWMFSVQRHSPLESHVVIVAKTAFYHLQWFCELCYLLSWWDLVIVTHGLVTSSLNYCNVLLCGTAVENNPGILVQNTAARVVSGATYKEGQRHSKEIYSENETSVLTPVL